MHQAHKIPWNVFPEHTKFMAENPAFIQYPNQFFARGKPGQAKALNHFVRVMISTIEDFSATERKKYPLASEFTFPNSGKLFSDSLKEKYSEFLDDRSQNIEDWIAQRSPGHKQGEYHYQNSHVSLAEVIKILITENEMETLLMLANHPKISLQSLCHQSWGIQYGFSRVMASALDAYLFFNITSATGDLANGNWRQLYWFSSMLDTSTRMDYPAEEVPHKRFFALPDHGNWPRDENGSLSRVKVVRDISQDHQGLHDYLKLNFELLYRYDMLIKELKAEAPWQKEIVRSFGWRIRGLKVEEEWDAEKNEWKAPVFV